MSNRPLTVKEAKAMFEATDSARLQEEERARLASKPKIVAECWTCNTILDENSDRSIDNMDKCGAAGHDVRPVSDPNAVDSEDADQMHAEGYSTGVRPVEEVKP